MRRSEGRCAGIVVLLLMTIAVTPGLSAQEQEASAAARACDWLLGVMAQERWGQVSAAQSNTAGRIVVIEAMTALALQAEGRELPRELSASLARHVVGSSMASSVFSSWLDGALALHLAERSRRGEVQRRGFRQLIRRFENGQNDEGGWGHGSLNGIDFYPPTLIATCNLALMTMGFGARFEVEGDAYVRADALALLRAVQAPGGGFPYGGKSYRKGVEVGRTAGTIVALAALEMTEGELFDSAARYVADHLAEIPLGHASPALHVMLGSLAAYALGPETWEVYAASVLARLEAKQRADGSFDDLIPSSPDTLEIMASEDRYLRGYITALYAAALSVPRLEIAGELRRAVGRSFAPGVVEAPVFEEPAFTRPVAAGTQPLLVGDELWLFRDLARIERCDRDGRTLAPIEVEQAEDLRVALVKVAGDLVLIHAGVDAGGGTEGACLLLAWNRKLGREAWRVALEDIPVSVVIDAAHAGELHQNGRLTIRKLADGAVVKTESVGSAILNSGLALVEGLGIAVANQDRLLFVPYEGRGWQRRNRSSATGHRPAVTAMTRHDGHLVFGSSDGELRAVDVVNGREVWTRSFPVSIRALATSPGAPDLLAVLTCDRALTLLEKGEVRWRKEAAEDGEPAPHSLIGTAGGFLLRETVDGPWRHLDLAGELRATMPAGKDGAVGLGPAALYLVNGHELSAYLLH